MTRPFFRVNELFLISVIFLCSRTFFSSSWLIENSILSISIFFDHHPLWNANRPVVLLHEFWNGDIVALHIILLNEETKESLTI